ncbi:MAG: hypothetical protein QOH95_742 [Gaiellaceae bacterium]|jgi:hypothetical protein|nr:hypothetical protein [Gaiellaceae bacterium]
MRFVLVVVLLALSSAVAATGSTRPTIALVQASPVVVRGSGFAPGRAVAVTYASGATHARRIATAGAQGAVSVVFRGLRFDRCRGAKIHAQAASDLVILPCTAPNGRPHVSGTLAGLVRGVAFVPGEHVRVTVQVSDSDPVTATIDAGPTGDFAAQVPIKHAPCAEIFFRAVGSLGSTATFTAASPACKAP